MSKKHVSTRDAQERIDIERAIDEIAATKRLRKRKLDMILNRLRKIFHNDSRNIRGSRSGRVEETALNNFEQKLRDLLTQDISSSSSSSSSSSFTDVHTDAS